MVFHPDRDVWDIGVSIICPYGNMWKDEMNQYYQLLYDELDSGKKQWLISSQDEWKLFTKENEELAWQTYDQIYHGGTIMRIFEAEIYYVSIDNYEDKKKEYEIIVKYSKIGINMSLPIAFGICNQHQSVYMILSWVEGQELEEVLPCLSIRFQYNLGRSAGEILRKIHSISVSEIDMPSETKKNKKLLQLSKYEKSNVRIVDDEIALKFIYDNIDKIWNEKPVYQ